LFQVSEESEKKDNEIHVYHEKTATKNLGHSVSKLSEKEEQTQKTKNRDMDLDIKEDELEIPAFLRKKQNYKI